MPIVDSHFVRGKIGLEEICELYKQLVHYEKEGESLVADLKKQGTTMVYNIARKEATQLISKARKYGLEEFFPFFGDRIKKIREIYDLKK
jgi:hypothetical protein